MTSSPTNRYSQVRDSLTRCIQPQTLEQIVEVLVTEMIIQDCRLQPIGSSDRVVAGQHSLRRISHARRHLIYEFQAAAGGPMREDCGTLVEADRALRECSVRLIVKLLP